MAEFSYNLDFRQLSDGLNRLTIRENFESFIAENITISAGTEQQITYQLQDGKLAKYYLNLGQTGNGLVTKGDTAWTAKHIYLKNHGAESVTITVAILGD